MDEIVYAIGLIAPFALTLLAVLAKGLDKVGSYLVAGITALGGIAAIYVFLGLGQDGDLTMTTSTGVLSQLSSATLNLNTWYFVTYIPLVFAGFAFMSAIYRAWRA